MTLLYDDKKYCGDVAEALRKAVETFYDYLREKGWEDSNIAIEVTLYKISSDYSVILEELHYSNIGLFLENYEKFKFSSKGGMTKN